MDLVIKLVIIVVSCAFFFYASSILVASWCAFSATFRRNKKEKWSRDETDDLPEKQAMYHYGIEWRNEHINHKKDVFIENDGLKLFGEYYDFGYEKCVIVLLGRSECFYDSFYYVNPYIKNRFNVLAIDSRAHGLSDGKYHTFGFEESKDYIKWAKYIHDTFNIKHIVFHGICVGASAGLFSMISDQCPDYIDALIGEGMHIRLFETVKNHIKKKKKPVYPLIYLIDVWIRLFTGHTITEGPVDYIQNYRKPILMLHSKQDSFSLPIHAQQLYDLCPSENKKIVFFENGEHSLVRANNAEEYDRQIELFLSTVYSDSYVKVG